MIITYKNNFISTDLLISADLIHPTRIEIYFSGGDIVFWDFKSPNETEHIFNFLQDTLKQNKNIFENKISIDYEISEYKALGENDD